MGPSNSQRRPTYFGSPLAFKDSPPDLEHLLGTLPSVFDMVLEKPLRVSGECAVEVFAGDCAFVATGRTAITAACCGVVVSDNFRSSTLNGLDCGDGVRW